MFNHRKHSANSHFYHNITKVKLTTEKHTDTEQWRYKPNLASAVSFITFSNYKQRKNNILGLVTIKIILIVNFLKIND